MIRRSVVLPLLGRIGEHTTRGTWLDAFVNHRRQRAISRLSDRDLDRLNRIRRPPRTRP
ncbi:MAG: hypothetical protein ACRD2C_17700 [Acidimicrobiales bacterium]